MTLLRQLLEQDESASTFTQEPAVNPVVDAALEQLRAGARFVLLQHDDIGARAAALEAIVEQCQDGQTKLAWIGNPLRSPLTIERVFLQAVGAEADLRVERSPAELAAMLSRSAGTTPRLILIIQQPETLDPEARETIAALAACLPAADPQVQFLFSGTTSFQKLEAEVAAPPSRRSAWRPHRAAVPVFAVLLLIGLSVLAAPKLLDRPADPDPAAAEPVTTLSAVEPPITNLAPSPPAPPPTSRLPNVDTTVLRREFESFLAQRAPIMPSLSESQKDALFQEFLLRQRQRGDSL